MKVLTEREIFLAISRLLLNGETAKDIADKIGKSRSYVQRRHWLTRMPDEIVNAYFEGRINDAMLRTLSKAQIAGNLAEVWAGIDTKPVIRKVWESPSGQRMKTQFEIFTRYEKAKGKEKEVLKWVLGL